MFGVYIFDIGGSLIATTVVNIKTGTGIFTATFDALSNNTYRFIIHTQSASTAGPSTLKLDAVRVSPVPAAIVSHLGHFNANDATFPATNPAGGFSRNGHPILLFDDGTAENVIFHGVMSRDYASASPGNILVDLDWVAPTVTTGDVTWGVEFERVAPGGQDIDSDSFATQQTGTSTTNGTTGVVTRTTISLTQTQADSIEAGEKACALFR